MKYIIEKFLKILLPFFFFLAMLTANNAIGL